MERIYFKYTPVRRGLTGAEYMEQFLDENFPGSEPKFTSIISDGVNHFGFLEGTDNNKFSKAINTIEGRFSCKKLSTDVFIGECFLLYNPPTLPGGGDPPTFAQFMSNYGITVTGDGLSYVKTAKNAYLKEVVRKKLEEDPDMISNLTKALMALHVYYPTLSNEQKAEVDGYIDTLKGIYTLARSIEGLGTISSQLSSVVGNYYSTKAQIEAATTLEDFINLNL